MKNAPEIECKETIFPLFRGRKTPTLPRLLSSAWHAKDGKTAYIVVNPEETKISFSIEDSAYEIEPLDAILIVR